jgi:HK97 family phage portal protein
MGFLDNFRRQPQTVEAANPARISAQVNPAIYDSPYSYGWGTYGFGGWNNYANSINRLNAISVPAVRQCRDLICNTIASIPLEMYSKTTGEEIPSPSWLKQPDLRASLPIIIAWTVDSLLMYGQAFWRVEEIFADDNRPARFEWIQNDRISAKFTEDSSEVDYYMINGTRVPESGIGSLITFQAMDQGILLTGARTIQSAIDIERAANVASQTPQPSGYIKNNGADLPDDKVQGLLNTWKNARQNRATAYLTNTLDYVATSFSPKDMMYNEAAQFLAAQIARLCNVPAQMINAEVMRSNTYQNVLDARKEFLAYTLQPFISAIEARLSLDDLTPRGSVVRFSVDETFLRANAMDRLAVTEKLLELGLINLDQAKSMEDLAPEGDGEIDESNI